MTNYFEFYKIPIRFVVDETLLRQKFLDYSKKYHPDFYTLESPEKQQEVLELSTLNNQAYKMLSDFDTRIQYILELKGFLKKDQNNKLAPDFLMEMMEINEQAAELQFEPDAAKKETLRNLVRSKERELLESVKNLFENYEDTTEHQSSLQQIQDYYFKRQYIKRLKQNLDSRQSDRLRG